MDEYEEPEKDGELTGAALEKILKVLLDYAAEKRTFTGKQCCIQGSV